MSKCLNCGTNLSCGCQKRVASDGTSVCTTCISAYEINIATLKKSLGISQKSDNKDNTPKVTGIDIKFG